MELVVVISNQCSSKTRVHLFVLTHRERGRFQQALQSTGRRRSRMEPPFGFFYSQVQGGKARAL